MASKINADLVGLVDSADSSGELEIQTKGTTAISISDTQKVTINNLSLPGGTSGQVLSTNGAGTLSWNNPTPGQIQSDYNQTNSSSLDFIKNKPTLGTAAATDASDYATAAQGALADSAVQLDDLAPVATSGSYNDLVDKPTLGTVASTDSTAYATAAQGALADSAVQPEDLPTLATVATSGSYNDLVDKPTIPAAQIQSDYNQTNSSSLDFIKNKPTLGTSASRNVGSVDDATATEVVLGNDSRLSDARNPKAHGHAWSQITSTPTTLAGYGITDAAPALNTETINVLTGGTVVSVPTSYTPGMIIVFVNGVRQTDFTATTGTSITFPFLLDGDEVSIVKFTPFNVANAVPQAGGTISGDLTVSGKIINDSVIQPGFISLIPNSMSVPNGYLLCDGSTISESAHPNLVGKLPAAATSGQLQLPASSEVTSGSAVKAIIKV